ncbi:MAG: DUF3685 domain-containing protein, partial [Snowella sp.]
VKICLLTATLEYGKLIQARQQGIEGYFPKGTSINELVEGLQNIVGGRICWTDLSFFQGYVKLTPKNRWLLEIFQSGLAQIDSNIGMLNQQFEQSPLSQFDILFLEGRKRELRTARWFVQKIMPNKLKLTAQLTAKEKLTSSPQASPLAKISAVNAPVNSDLTIEPIPSSNITIFSTILAKLQAGVSNLTDIPLELDILVTEKKQELLILILNQFQNLLTELKSLNVTLEQLPDDTSLILVEIWQASTLAFFGKYCSPKGDFKINKIQEILTNYKTLIQTEALSKIPFTQELLHYLLFSENLIIDQVSYRAKSPEAEERAEIYLQNLIIQIANGVMIFILNYFSDSEEIKQVLYS